MNKFLIILCFLLIVSNGYALRASRPFILKYPLDQEQISQLNKYMEEIWFMQNGRSEFDIGTSQKTMARNGELWFIDTGGVIRIQIKGSDQIFTFTPDGY